MAFRQPFGANPIDELLARIPNYKHPSTVRSHVLECTRQYPSLRPKFGNLPKADGTPSHCICLGDTIPIFYAQRKYNIPVNIWVEESYPYSVPVAYVIPTKGMYLYPNHPNVDRYGRVMNVTSVTNWKANASNLTDFVTDISIAFGKKPPVSSGPPRGQPQQPVQQPQYGQPQQQYGQQTYGQNPQQQAQQVALTNAKALLLGKVRSVVETQIPKANTEINQLLNEQATLQKDASGGAHVLENLQSEKDKLVSQNTEMLQKIADITQWIQGHQGGEIDVDAAIRPKDIASRQLADISAEDLALEDLMYYLAKGLGQGIVGIDDFVREVKRQSSKQYQIRALRRKIRVMQGLDPLQI